MAQVNESELKSNIKNGRLERVYYFYGKDISAVETYTKLVLSKALKKGDETCNLHTFEGKTLTVGILSEASEALPVFAEYVCCTVCDLNAETMNADSLNTLTQIINELPDTTILIFYNTSIDVTDGRKYPTAKNKKLIEAVSKNGLVCEFAFKSASVLAKDIMVKSEKNGSIISKRAAEYLAEACGCDTMIIGNEIKKLLAYADGNEITIDMIDMLTPRQLEATVFDLARAIVKHDKKNAVRILDDLIIQKVEPISIMYAVTSSMVDLYRARVAVGSNKSVSDVTTDFLYAKNTSFRVSNAFRDVRSISLSHLRECMKILTKADIDMKSLRTDKQIILEEAIIKMLSNKENNI